VRFMLKNIKQPYCWLLLASLFIMLLTLVFPHSNDIKIRGFAIDSQGNLYVGRLHQIEVYRSDGEIIRTIAVPNYRSWAFAVSDEDTFIISNTSTVYEMNASGQILSEASDIGGEMFREMYNTTIVYQEEVSYMKKNCMGWTRIVRDDGTCVYKIPIKNFLINRINILASVIFLTIVFIHVLDEFRKRTKVASKTGDEVEKTGDGSLS